ncbi:hypothetical protein [Halobacterium rubrum]|uniref:hypothetical protein n=1 Tax=Halobacterium TaxID=2239 RepID=UPI001F1AA9EF|nr:MULTISPECIES: hypothetical protein [Halobacterium]MDH5020338.1 hypothetical protein [Halobacterium rubrum]
MSLWRSKRRYDTGRRFSEQADDALYALALLQSDGTVTKTRTSELREDLEEGEAVFRALRDALQHPEKADSYTYALARQLREHYGEIDKYAIERLNRHLELLDKAGADLTYYSGLEDVIEALELIEELAEQTTEQDAEQLRDYVATSDY